MPEISSPVTTVRGIGTQYLQLLDGSAEVWVVYVIKLSVSTEGAGMSRRGR